MLALFDSNYQLFNGEPLRTVHNGKTGGADDKLLFIRNDDSTCYYTDIIVSYDNSQLDDYGEFGSTGWSFKLLHGSRRPTEAEWDSVRSGESISIGDIGSTVAADTYTFHPFWIRAYCPGNSPAQIREGQAVRVWFDERKVGT